MLSPEKSDVTKGIDAGAISKKGAAAQLHVIRMPDWLAPKPLAGSLSTPCTTIVSKVLGKIEALPLA